MLHEKNKFTDSENLLAFAITYFQRDILFSALLIKMILISYIGNVYLNYIRQS
jgi:hypothetical protein